MKKNRWLFVILGAVALVIALLFSVAFGAGVTYFLMKAEPVQAAIKGSVDVGNEEGILISSVKPESSAAAAGLVRGDIILEINGEPVNHVIEMKEIFVEMDPGDLVELTVLHGDDTRYLEVALDEFEGLAFLGVGTCDFPIGSNALPGGPMGDVFIQKLSVGAEVMEVMPDSPAESAGLQIGDLILSVDQKPVGLKGDLAELIQNHEPGDMVVLEILSGMDEEPYEVEVTLGEHPDKPGHAYLGVAYQMGSPMSLKGGAFPFIEGLPFGELPEGFEGEEGMPHFFFHHGEDFDGELPEEWEKGMPHFFNLPTLPEGVEGAVIISDVIEDTPAAEAGLAPNDLIIAVDGEPVGEIEAFVDEMQSRQPGDEITLTILRNDEEIEVKVILAEHPDDPDKGYLGVLAGTFVMMDELSFPEGFDQDFEFEIPDLPGGDA